MATEATSTAVCVSGVKIMLEAGEGKITGLRVGNPQGLLIRTFLIQV